MLIIGSHVGLSAPNYFYGSVKEAISYKANAMMIYTGAPQNTFRTDVTKLKVGEAKLLLTENHISLDNVIVHAPYIVNLGTSDPEKFKFAVSFLTNELKSVNYIGAKYMVLHPGNHLTQTVEYAINNIAEGINQILANTKDNGTVILLETMSGKGTEIGRNFEEIKGIIDLVKDKTRVGVCLDTCHIHDAGMDISNFDLVLDEFDKTIGLSYLKCLHVNDSKNEREAHKDRHENIGFGYLGFENIINIIYNKRIEGIPKILETPYIDKIYPPYLFEIEMIKNREFDSNLKEKIIRYYGG